jgi:hypothetical protein
MSDWMLASVRILVSASRLTYSTQQSTNKKSIKSNQIELYTKLLITHLFRGFDGNEIIVDLLGYSCHLLRFGVFVLFDSQPKIQILVAEFAQ